MKTNIRVLFLGLLLVTVGAVGASAQQKSDAAGSTSSTPPSTNSSTPPATNSSASTPSLGDLARKMKAEKAKDPKPAKVFTNDNLPNAKWDDAVVSSTADKDSGDAGAGTPSVHDEKYYRAQMSKLQGQLDTDQRELDVLQQKLGQGNMQYYSDPNKELQQEYNRFEGTSGGSDLNKLNADIAAKKDQITKDQQAIDDLRDQLRREGGDPGWLR